LLENAFRTLTAQQRQVIELAYYEGLSQTAIAERLGQPLGTVKGWTRGALQKMRLEMQDRTARRA
jgi:RNA polymerase sigma-70 factor (ECF subfamily)